MSANFDRKKSNQSVPVKQVKSISISGISSSLLVSYGPIISTNLNNFVESRALIERTNRHEIGPHDFIRNPHDWEVKQPNVGSEQKGGRRRVYFLAPYFFTGTDLTSSKQGQKIFRNHNRIEIFLRPNVYSLTESTQEIIKDQQSFSIVFCLLMNRVLISVRWFFFYLSTTVRQDIIRRF